ncbi:hypothetical protein Bhyg_11299, partial [Pseudolycoriella hygida]
SPSTGSTTEPTTPKHASKHRDDDFATPKSHYIHDDDPDLSPHPLPFSQRPTGVEVIWEEKNKSTPFKSKYACTPLRDTASPPTNPCLDVEPPANDSPKGLFRFLLQYRKRQIEDDIQRIESESSEKQDMNTASSNCSELITATERVESTSPIPNESHNFMQLLNDSEDMNLMLCSQKIEEEICKPPVPVHQTIASKGFSDMFSDDDDFLLANLEDPLLVDKKASHSQFTRHKSIAIQPNSLRTNATVKSNQSNYYKNTAVTSKVAIQTEKKSEALTSTNASQSLVRHKSMPSPNVTIANTTKKCTAEEIAIKREIALAKLKLRKERF